MHRAAPTAFAVHVLAAFLVSSCAGAVQEAASSRAGSANGAMARAIALPPLLSDGAVLQRDARVEVWGTAPANVEIALDLSWSDAAPVARSDAEGRFSLHVETDAAGGPHTIELSAPGCEPVAIDDVLFGEVWLASGQSNMEWTIEAARWNDLDEERYAAAVEGAADDELRFFQLPNRIALEPQGLCTGTWRAATPENVPGFSAVALFFARALRAELDVPVGIVQSDWGGTVCEAWTSREALAGRFDGAFDAALAQIDAELAEPGTQGDPLAVQQDRWWRNVEAADPGLARGWHAGAVDRDGDADGDASAWRDVAQPGDPDPAFDGCLWLRREVAIPAQWAGRDLVLHLGPIDDMDVVWLDGHEVAATKVWGRWNDPRHYRVPGERVAGGSATLAVLCVDTGGGAGLHGRAEQMYVHPEGDAAARVELAGTWRYRRGAALADLGSYPTTSWFGPNHPTALFNGMIAPLERTRLRGAIWYQGESNAGRPRQYAELFPALIEDWRRRFRAASDAQPFPFYFVQIAPFRRGSASDSWTELRLAQAAVVPGASGVPERFHRAALPHTGMVVTSDVGDPNDVHPRRKRPVGERLANWALARTYAPELTDDDPRAQRWRERPHRSPQVASAERDGAAVRVRFDGTGAATELVVAGGAAPDTFELAGPDGVFHLADAELVESREGRGGRTVRLTSRAVPEPVSVRYSWASDAMPNLRTRSGLPIGPFALELDAR